eukprot:760947-Hanusia_phi.AAC.13
MFPMQLMFQGQEQEQEQELLLRLLTTCHCSWPTWDPDVTPAHTTPAFFFPRTGPAGPLTERRRLPPPGLHRLIPKFRSDSLSLPAEGPGAAGRRNRPAAAALPRGPASVDSRRSRLPELNASKPAHFENTAHILWQE